MVKLVKPISPGSDRPVTGSASVSYSWCKLGAHTTSTICNHTFGLSNFELFHTWAVLAGISASRQTLPHSSLNKAVHHQHPLHAQSPPAAFDPYTFNAAVWPVSPAGAAGRRQPKRFPRYHGSPWMTLKGYIDPIFRRLAGRALPVQASLFHPVFYPVTCRISTQQRQSRTTFAKASYTRPPGWSFPAARAIKEDRTTQPFLLDKDVYSNLHSNCNCFH